VTLPMQNVHPLIVHFPIALLLTAWLLTLGGWLTRRENWHRVATVNLLLGGVGALVAVLTGLRAAATATPHSMAIHDVMELHERLGISVAWGSGLLLLWRLLRRRMWPMRGIEQLGQMLLLTVVMGLLVYGAHLGGRLVYEFGVGTTVPRAPSIRIEQPPTHTH